MHACRWIQDQYANHRSEFWRNGLEEYLQYGREIQAKFPVAADSQADAPSTSTAGKQHSYMLTPPLASGTARHDAWGHRLAQHPAVTFMLVCHSLATNSFLTCCPYAVQTTVPKILKLLQVLLNPTNHNSLLPSQHLCPLHLPPSQRQSTP